MSVQCAVIVLFNQYAREHGAQFGNIWTEKATVVDNDINAACSEYFDAMIESVYF